MGLAPPVQASPGATQEGQVGLGALFVMFLKAGLAFGGGSGILAALQYELVEKRKGLTRSEYLTLFALGRITPCGNLMAMAIACGYRFQGLAGTFVALAAMIVPSLVITLVLTALYAALNGTPALAVVSATLMPAALGLVSVQALRMSQEYFKPCIEIVLALGCFIGAVVFGVSAPLLLLIGGLIGILVIRESGDTN